VRHFANSLTHSSNAGRRAPRPFECATLCWLAHLLPIAGSMVLDIEGHSGCRASRRKLAPDVAGPRWRHRDEKAILKLLLPALVMEAVLGVGLSLTYLAFHGNHKAAKIAVVVVGFAAWVAWMWTAFKVGIFRRRVVTSIAAASSGASTVPSQTARIRPAG
jgi:hypothetical protein